MELNISRLIDGTLEPAELSGSIAERGVNAGPDTWANAQAAATAAPLTTPEQHAELRDFFAGFGAWEREEINAWTPAELDALALQYAAGDLRELQAVCPGAGLGGIDWKHASAESSAGAISGSIYAGDDGQLYIYMGN